MDCPVGTICALLMPAPTIITLPLISSFVGHCGSEIYHALVDETPVDGLKEEITVTDNTNNTCPTFNILPETEVQYNATNPWVGKTTYSRFNGTALKLLPTIF